MTQYTKKGEPLKRCMCLAYEQNKVYIIICIDA